MTCTKKEKKERKIMAMRMMLEVRKLIILKDKTKKKK
jgi:hypothetical protein